MKAIKLTQGKSVKVSDEDYEYLGQWKWRYDNGYAVRGVRINGKKQTISMYKVILTQMGIKLQRRLKIRYKLDYRREILTPPLDLSPGPKEIPLSQGKVALVDLEDYEYLMQWNWFYSGGYASRRVCGKNIQMHRVILERMGIKNFKDTDHINRNKVDNCRANLRPATRRENSQNTPPSLGSSKYKGVSWHKSGGKWVA